MVKTINPRAIDDDFLDEFLNGKLNKLLHVIQQDDTLIMCLRGNYTDVYYRSCCILEISKTFNFSVNKDYGIDFGRLKGAVNFDEKDWIDYFRYAKQLIDYHSFKKRIDKKVEEKNIRIKFNMSKLIIHRGTQEIGGSALEINNGETSL